MESDRVIVTVVGKDRVGIIARVAATLAELNVNILDISQTLMQEFFTMVMICDLAGASADLAAIQESLSRAGQEIGVQVTVQHEQVFKFMHRI